MNDTPSTALQLTEPANLLERAVSSGASIEVLERLMGLQERYQAQKAKAAFDNAMSDFRLNIPPILKNQTVDFSGNRGRTHYKYEDLADICEVLSPAMAPHGLAFRWRTETGNPVTVTCIISHREGHREECSLSAPWDESGNKNIIQGLGSAISYLQRYTLKAALGVAASQDDDGQSAGARPSERQQQQRAPAPATKASVLPQEATEDMRARAFDILKTEFGGDLVLEFLDIKEVKDWPLKDVPTGKRALGELSNEIAAWIAKRNDAVSAASSETKFTEPFWNAVITMPRAGTKAKAYFEKPDTIRSLYEACKAGDRKECERLYGLVSHYDPKPFNGQPVPQSELDCRAALDLFEKWHVTHEEAKHKQEQPDLIP